MSTKAKKIRQMYRRQVRAAVEKQAQEFASFIKPRPRWMPYAVWKFFLSLFIRVK